MTGCSVSLMIFATFSALLALCAMAAGEDTSEWFAFRAQEDFGPSVIGMADWLDAPAGKYGPVKMVGDRFELANGQPIKFWGVNLGNADCAPPKEMGKHWAAGHAKYGVNCARLHKFIGPGRSGIGDPSDSTRYTADGLDRLDFFSNELRNRGIYYGWSWIFEHKVRPGDRDKLLAYDEIVAAGGSTLRVPLFIGEDIQNLRIEMLKTLLNHRNPYTGLTYAEDPALAFIELQNEDSIFFYTFGGFNKLDVMPTYKKRFLQRFSNWLKDKYGSHEKLVEAWGKEAMNAYEVKNEDLAKGNIMVQGNPWFFSPEGLDEAKQAGTVKRLLDTAAFLHHVQSDYYKRFAKAIRETGYEGPLIGSCWTTPAGLPQYYNLHNDYEIGFIDRHSYFGKGTHRWRTQPGQFQNDTHLEDPGSGILSMGLLQVKDRPFAISEWTNVFPNEWTMETPVLIAAYGMGLQGWDGSYQFSSHIREYRGKLFASHLGDPRLWVVDIPSHLGLYPVLARMLYRGDVKEAPIISTRRVSVDELREGKPEWIHEERIRQDFDFKQHEGVVDPAALAAGRVVVDFVDAPAKSDLPEMDKYVRDGAVWSTTDQLTWFAGDGDKQHAGWVRIDTEGTKAMLGFLPDAPVKFNGAVMESPNRFAGIFVTSLDPDKTIAQADRLLLATMARVHNTGMRYEGEKLLSVGRGPMLIEPVKAKITLPGRSIKRIRVLDHDGRRTSKVLDADGASFEVDGSRDKTIYYEVELE